MNGCSSRAAGLEASTSGIDVVERCAQVDESRVRAPHEVGELADGARELLLAIADRVHHQVQVADQGRDVGRSLGERAGELRGVDDQVLEGALIGVELAEDPPRSGKERVQVLEALVGLRPDALVGLLEALDHVLEVLDRLRRERVEELVEVDLGGRLGQGQRSRRNRSRRRRSASGGRLSCTWRPAICESEGERTVAVVPRLQRRIVLADRERDQRLALRAELDLLDRADRGACRRRPRCR